MKLLYIGENIEEYFYSSGAQVVNYRNFSLLFKIFNGNVDVIVPINVRRGLIYKWGGGKTFLKTLEIKLKENHYDYLFLSQSLLGNVAKYVKDRFPEVKQICFFHNIEIQYAKEYVRTSGVLHYPFYLSAKIAESKTVKNSDYYIVLNERDATCMKNLYGVSPHLILPTSFEDKFQPDRIKREFPSSPDEITYLFVGAAFFANIEGISWFIKKVLPFVPGTLLVVGRGMDKQSCLKHDRVKLVGFVEDLSSYYYNATFVVAPILSGGGMKTKTAEALMYGKSILGTTEAFEGYIPCQEALLKCNTASEYINCIDYLVQHKRLNPFNESARKLFEEHYSLEASYNSMKQFFYRIMKK